MLYLDRSNINDITNCNPSTIAIIIKSFFVSDPFRLSLSISSIVRRICNIWWAKGSIAFFISSAVMSPSVGDIAAADAAAAEAETVAAAAALLLPWPPPLPPVSELSLSLRIPTLALLTSFCGDPDLEEENCWQDLDWISVSSSLWLLSPPSPPPPPLPPPPPPPLPPPLLPLESSEDSESSGRLTDPVDDPLSRFLRMATFCVAGVDEEAQLLPAPSMWSIPASTPLLTPMAATSRLGWLVDAEGL